MKNLKPLLAAGWLLSTVTLAHALNYGNSDLLLVFRKDGFNDIEFDLGSVSNYLGLAQGTTKTIPYDAGLAQTNFNGSLADVSFLLLAATGLGDPNPRLWLTDNYPNTTPTDVTSSKFSQIRSKISSIGMQGTIFTASNSLPAVVPSGQAGSFTYVASDGNLTPASSLGGLTGFPVEGNDPATLKFFELHITTARPQPAASLIGSFSLDNAGVLHFNAGSSVALTAPRVTGIVRNGTTFTLSFTTASGLKYQLSSAPAVTGPFQTVGSMLTGDGQIQTLSDTSSEAVRFYRIQATN